MNIALTLIFILFGLAFLFWGIYQIRTGRMVAKNRSYSIDEPREVGYLFLAVAYFFFFSLPTVLISSSPAYAAHLAEPVFSSIFFIYGLLSQILAIYIFVIAIIAIIRALRTRSIPTIRHNKSLDPLTRRLSIPFALLLSVPTLFWLSMYIITHCPFSFTEHPTLAIIRNYLFIFSTLCFLAITIIYIYIYEKSKKSTLKNPTPKKITPKKSQKSSKPRKKSK